jgi:tetratricopeptide (TPR) repeat protein
MTEVADKELPTRAYARLLLQLHPLIEQGKGDTEEADAIRERMEEPWYAMTEQEQERFRWLSADLYALAEGGPKPIEMNTQERADYGRRFGEALRARDWDHLLDLLRRPPKDTATDAVVFLQARFWDHLGDREVALALMRGAERLNPEANATFVMTLLGWMGRAEEEEVAARAILANARSSPESIYLAAGVVLRATQGKTGEEARQEWERLVPLLRHALGATLAEPRERRLLPDLDPYIVCMLGFFHEKLGQKDEARKLYTEALTRNPGDPEVLGFRGTMLYPSDPAAALEDFKKAADAGSSSAWPYYFLARHALLREAYRLAGQMTVAALKRAGLPSRMQAELHEWLGICQSVFGQSSEQVRGSFDRALELDPGNQRIIQNQAVALKEAEKPKGLPGGLSWQVTQRTEPAVVHQGLRGRIDAQQVRAGQQMDESQLFAHVS